ncbi:MAG: cbb3-type cytochrome oxidase assembly protein CcoS [Alphaproteobacteria bacterium]|nr:cbb3-type cytochrome oxidase assembly protein CcoS [Alphaproteobacteria bacterium]
MIALTYLLPAALFLGLFGLVCFLWALRSGQFEDLDGAAHRVLHDAHDDRLGRPPDDGVPPRPDQLPGS